MKGNNNDTRRQQLKKHTRGLLVRLTGLTITGIALTAIGQPSATHVLSRVGHDFWNVLLVIHLLFLLFIAINALAILRVAFHGTSTTKQRAFLGASLIVFGTVSGTLSFHHVHSALTLFFVGVTTVLLVLVYGPIAAKLFYAEGTAQ